MPPQNQHTINYIKTHTHRLYLEINLYFAIVAVGKKNGSKQATWTSGHLTDVASKLFLCKLDIV